MITSCAAGGDFFLSLMRYNFCMVNLNHKTFFWVVIGIFTVIAILHGFRLFYQWPAVIGGFEIPMWASYLAVAIAAYLAYQASRIAKR